MVHPDPEERTEPDKLKAALYQELMQALVAENDYSAALSLCAHIQYENIVEHINKNAFANNKQKFLSDALKQAVYNGDLKAVKTLSTQLRKMEVSLRPELLFIAVAFDRAMILNYLINNHNLSTQAKINTHEFLTGELQVDENTLPKKRGQVPEQITLEDTALFFASRSCYHELNSNGSGTKKQKTPQYGLSYELRKYCQAHTKDYPYLLANMLGHDVFEPHATVDPVRPKLTYRAVLRAISGYQGNATEIELARNKFGDKPYLDKEVSVEEIGEAITPASGFGLRWFHAKSYRRKAFKTNNPKLLDSSKEADTILKTVLALGNS